jgi:hypothetical protein
MASDAPGGLTLASFESTCLEVGDWIWGTAQGAFNEKATMSQIIVDAAIGMIPVVGDVTGVRDLLAVVIGLSMDPRKREDKTQWVLLIVLALALVPVVGGVVKGVGRLLIKAIGEAAQLAGQAEKAARLAAAAKDIVAFLNRVGVGNAERWLIELHFAQYQKAVMQQLDELAKAVSTASNSALQHVGGWLPESLVNGTEALAQGAENFRQLVPKYIPDAVKELDEYLTELQKYIRSGGETTSQTISHPALPGPSRVNRTADLVLLEGSGAKMSPRGGLAANSALPAEVAEYYEKAAGYPDLLYAKVDKATGEVTHPNIATYAGKIVNRDIETGERLFRVFGPATTTHSFPVGKSFAAGGRLGSPSFWGLNKVPKDADSWRHGSAVLDEWNGNGFMVVGTLLEGKKCRRAPG